MNRDALLAEEPPAPLEAACCRCGRWTLVPVPCAQRGEVVLYSCPDCVLLI
ncbi:hypothetical protein [Streptomyces sp. ST1015]|uniref:hypothetical protein n=1 Tax=unclassified Streptomyces TaxID=2593676 RepID=UPI0013A6E0CB|nr:hypothetical protein [Streptomyces sp. ST1015]QZZ24904.1 hypothetical protein A7X85_21940 [Streptomyces sp. ST1015]